MTRWSMRAAQRVCLVVATACVAVLVTVTAPVQARTGVTPLIPPTVTGPAQVGAVLTASPGTWSATPDSVNFQWLADGSPAAGATSKQFVVTPLHLGQQITVTVTALSSGETSTATSEPTAAVTASPWRRVSFPAGQIAVEVDCAAKNACFALASKGADGPLSLLTFDGSAWRVTRQLDGVHIGSMDCARGFCMVIYGEFPSRRYRYIVFEAGSWSAPRAMPLLPNRRGGRAWSAVFREVTCVSRGFCAAELGGSYSRGGGGSGGFLVRYVAARKVASKPRIPSALDLTDMLNFPTRRLRVNPWRHTKWILPRNVTPSGHLHNLACASPTTCIVQDSSKYKAGIFNGRGTIALIGVGSLETDVACQSPTWCIAGERRAWNGTKWVATRMASLEYEMLDFGCSAAAGCFGISPSDDYIYGNQVPFLAVLQGNRWRPTQAMTFFEPTSGMSAEVSHRWPTVIDCLTPSHCVTAGNGISFVTTG